jgi:hypothetical protein
MVYLNSDAVQHITCFVTCRRIYCLLLFDAVRLAPEEESHKLTGFVHNAVTCIGMETNIPVIFNSWLTSPEACKMQIYQDLNKNELFISKLCSILY